MYIVGDSHVDGCIYKTRLHGCIYKTHLDACVMWMLVSCRCLYHVDACIESRQQQQQVHIVVHLFTSSVLICVAVRTMVKR